MRVLVVYESLFGNTREIAGAVAAGIRAASPDAEVVCAGVDDDASRLPADLLVVGAPTHFLGMTSSLSRSMESQYERRLRRARGRTSRRWAGGTRGVRGWLAALPAGAGAATAVFDTRIEHGVTGSAARPLARRLHRRGYRIVTEPVSFAVDGIAGPLAEGALQRASAWERGLPARVQAAPPATTSEVHPDRPDHTNLGLHRRNTMSETTTTTRLPVDDADGSRLSFTTEYERDGTTVITGTRTHLRNVTPGAGKPRVRAEVSGRHPVGAFVVTDGQVRWRPAVDVTRVVTTAEVVVGAVLIAHRLSRRPGAAKARVTMGPGGWVSMKGGAVAVRPGSRPWGRRRPVLPPESTQRAPIWARVLSAVPLQSLVR